MDATPNSFTVKDYAYNSQTGSTSILAGQTTISGIEESSDNSLFMLYPNPTTGKFNMVMDNELWKKNDGNIDICNLLGEKIYQSEMPNHQSEIDISNQPKGIYFIRVEFAEKIFVQKLIVH